MGRLCSPGIAILVASVAVLIGLAAPAYADPTSEDANFLAALDNAGISYGSPNQAIAAGNAVCQLLSEGRGLCDLVRVDVLAARECDGFRAAAAGGQRRSARSPNCESRAPTRFM